MALIPQGGTNVDFPTQQYQFASVGYIWIVVGLQNPNQANVSLELWNSKSDKFNVDGTLKGVSPIMYVNAETFPCEFDSPNIGQTASQYSIDFIERNFGLTFVEETTI
jgi:hypothetical protein